MPLSHAGSSRTHRENLVLAFALASVAGAVNAIGFLELGVYTSNMSGAVTAVALSLVRDEGELLRRFLIIVGSFLCGAMTATLLVERARMAQRARYVTALLIEIFLLTTVATITEVADVNAHGLASLLMGALAYSMGMQNALVTKISGAVIRTTHLTGIITDVGIELVRLGLLVHERAKMGPTMLEHMRQATLLARDAEFYKARLHLTIFLSFVAGGALGAALLLHVGRSAMLMPIAVLLALVLYDHFFGGRIEEANHDGGPSHQLVPPAPLPGPAEAKSGATPQV